MVTWKEIVDNNPQHSHNYAQRWRMFAAQGRDIVGEARLVDALAPRNARILDAGCGTGRIGGWLAERGHTVVGTDIDPFLIEVARHDYPDARWEVGDLGHDPIPEGNFDVVVSAGNVMGFIDPRDRRAVLAALAGATAPQGRVVIGFGAGRGWDFADFLATAQDVGLHVDARFESWDLRPWGEESQFLVALMSV
ncbi:class I SAM-dependent methyltransferase [Corynebacterium uberis]|uniref:class I SAM-dependent methyltransferase n=1 Tax=Corynebacterium TaxID=1716 RepID=UPI001D0B25DA|nr:MULTISPECIES: class I SAM-dependent methyltransferase [Corynebacterium]MCZ9308689.1 class I SAM-dependent methyltransferase [Corynebacterium sp. c6VSa_13]UDL74328.1 class I SAM-dependent methyltransferase [Corynebacterium uberis]UDL76839.1 class I SAM-dependent methyltransferase [Corynebacterium uberis]UDL79052.1 class I SAM-dependent methyltransferase [Corynebacterium uberis]UDL79290.1 class I SAM-dependent methyltransferase [Corynebacterium uberis]